MTIVGLILLVVCGAIAWAINLRLPYAPKWIGEVIILVIGLVIIANWAGFSLGVPTH